MNRNWQRNLVLVAQRLIQIGKPGLRTVVDHARGEAEAERDKLRKILGRLVEIDDRDELCDPARMATDKYRNDTWEEARAALSETEQPE